MEQGDCGFWHEDKSCMGKLSCLSVRMWIWLISDELNIVVELLAAFSGTDTTFNYIFTFITKKKQIDWQINPDLTGFPQKLKCIPFCNFLLGKVKTSFCYDSHLLVHQLKKNVIRLSCIGTKLNSNSQRLKYSFPVGKLKRNLQLTDCLIIRVMSIQNSVSVSLYSSVKSFV